MKKLQNVRNDHEKRVTELVQVQAVDKHAAELISRNETLVEQARLAVQAAIANQVSVRESKKKRKKEIDRLEYVSVKLFSSIPYYCSTIWN